MSTDDAAGRGKRRQQVRAGRTTPAQGGFVRLDQTRTFLYSGAFVETMVQPDPIEGLVRLDMSGRWSQRVERLPDEPVLMMRTVAARELAHLLLEAADAADKDAERWKAAHP